MNKEKLTISRRIAGTVLVLGGLGLGYAAIGHAENLGFAKDEIENVIPRMDAPRDYRDDATHREAVIESSAAYWEGGLGATGALALVGGGVMLGSTMNQREQ